MMKCLGVLKLDFDKEDRRLVDRMIIKARLQDRMWLLQQVFPWRVDTGFIRRTKHGWHAQLIVFGPGRRLTRVQTVALQAVCGSDLKREIYNLARAMRTGVPPFWRERGNVLYRRKLK